MGVSRANQAWIAAIHSLYHHELEQGAWDTGSILYRIYITPFIRYNELDGYHTLY